MYTPFQVAFSNNNRIVAGPKRIFLPMLSYNKEAFDKLGLIPPTTYQEFFEFYLSWKDDYAYKYPEYTVDSLENYNMDLARLVKKYTDEMSKNNREARYQSESLQKVLEKYLAAHSIQSLDRESGAIPLFSIMDVPKKGSYEYLPLTFETENVFVIDVSPDDFAYFVVNPYSKNKEEAITFFD